VRILIASKYGPHGSVKIGGVQSWAATVEKALTDGGHEVRQYEYGQAKPPGRYDLGIISHWTFTGAVAPLCNEVVNVSHGVIDAERPKFGKRLFTSEEVREHWGVDGGIIRQPIDLDFWTPAVARREYLTRFSYRDGLDMAVDVARSLNLKYRHIKRMTPRQCREILRQSAVVLATGRAALEAMACGAPVVICDHRAPYQGPLLDTQTLGSMKRNYSGRGGQAPTPSALREACEVSMAQGSLRWHVEEHHNARRVVNDLLAYAHGRQT
jgi:glycosyltransferase involved in cell wall biosynthesis